MESQLKQRADCLIDFDHHSESFAADPAAALNAARETCPVAWSEAWGGFWLVTGYEEAFAILQDDDTFSSGREHGGVNIPPCLVPGPPIDVDPPAYWHYRKALVSLTSSGAVGTLREQVEAWSQEYLDAVIETGRADLVDDFGSPVPCKAVMALLGLPMENADRYAKVWHDIFAHAAQTSPTESEYLQFWPEIQLEIKETLMERTRCPMNDLTSQIAHSELREYLIKERGDSDVASELSWVVETLLAAGIDTTTNMFANTVIWLSQHPNERQRLIDDRSLIPSAVEEFLRYFATAHTLARNVMSDIDFHGHQFRAGDRVFVSFLGANLDPRTWDRPNEIIFDRTPNRHMAFGIGLHRCLGSNLARMVFPIMLNTLLDRIPDFQVIEDKAEIYPNRSIVNGWTTVPVTFTPAVRQFATSNES